MTGTVTQQGVFASLGVATNLPIVSGVDWINTSNSTAMALITANAAVIFYGQRTTDDSFVGWDLRNNAGGTGIGAAFPLAAGDFTLVNSSTAPLGAPVAITAISNANPPIVATASTAGLSDGSVVEIINTTGAKQFGGMTFTIDTIVANTSFRLKYAPQIVAGTNGFYRIVPFNPIFFPRRRFITAITVGATTQIKMSTQTTYTVGQLVRVIVPPAFGAISQNINGLAGTILAIDPATNIATLDINSTGFGAFTFPLTGAVPFTQAQLAPVGAGTNPADPTNLGDATENRAISGVQLAAGLTKPAGNVGDFITWQAGSSFSNTIVPV